MRKLGKRQRRCLELLIQHGGWPGGWIMGSGSETRKILDSLVKRELAIFRWQAYEATKAGRLEVGAEPGLPALRRTWWGGWAPRS